MKCFRTEPQFSSIFHDRAWSPPLWGLEKPCPECLAFTQNTGASLTKPTENDMFISLDMSPTDFEPRKDAADHTDHTLQMVQIAPFHRTSTRSECFLGADHALLTQCADVSRPGAVADVSNVGWQRLLAPATTGGPVGVQVGWLSWLSMGITWYNTVSVCISV